MLIPPHRYNRTLTLFRLTIGFALGAGAALASLCAWVGAGPFESRSADELIGAAAGIAVYLVAHARAHGIRE